MSEATGTTTRQRSGIAFPYDDLGAAADVVTIVHQQYGGTCEIDQLAASMGSSLNSGGFRGKIAAAKLFGLLAPERGSIAVTDLGRRVANPATQADALAEAFLNVPLYSAIHDEFRGATLPGPTGIEARIRALGVPVKQTKHARQVMMRSAEIAGYHGGGTDRLVKPPRKGPAASGADETETEKKSQSRDQQRDKGHDLGDMADHPLITGLWKMLPPPGEPFSEEQRRLWLRAADVNLALIYKGTPALAEDEDADVEAPKPRATWPSNPAKTRA